MGYCCEGFGEERFCQGRDLLPRKDTLREWTKKAFQQGEGIVFIGACGIAVRAVAPFLEDKFSDPAVVVIDEKAEFCIPLLSGHMGGANELAGKIRDITGAVLVLSTATDLQGAFAVDSFAKKNKLHLSDRNLAKAMSAGVLEGKGIFLTSELPVDGLIPNEIRMGKEGKRRPEEMQLDISIHRKAGLVLTPEILCLGIGCKKDTDGKELEAFIIEQLEKLNLSPKAIGIAASIDLKKEEKAFSYLSKTYGWKMQFYTCGELGEAEGSFEESEFVSGITGVGNVCERAAILASKGGSLLAGKTKGRGMTLAIAAKNRRITFE